MPSRTTLTLHHKAAKNRVFLQGTVSTEKVNVILIHGKEWKGTFVLPSLYKKDFKTLTFKATRGLPLKCLCQLWYYAMHTKIKA